MSWHYLQGPEAVSWEENSSGGKPSVLSRLIPTAEVSCSPDNETAFSTASPSGMTCGRSTGSRGEGMSMSSPQGSPVSRSAAPASNEAKTTAVTCGPRLSVSFVKFDPDSHSWKMFPALFLAATLAPYSGTWPKAGMMLDGVCYRQPRWERHIGERGCGYWPTPTRADRSGHAGQYPKTATHHEGLTLATAVRGYWPTPRASDREGGPSKSDGKRGASLRDYCGPNPTKAWPMPTARDWRSGKASQETMNKNSRPLNEAVVSGGTRTQQSGRLNPAWVEWLMGWPITWSALKPLATGRYRQWLKLHGKY